MKGKGYPSFKVTFIVIMWCLYLRFAYDIVIFKTIYFSAFLLAAEAALKGEYICKELSYKGIKIQIVYLYNQPGH